MPHIALSSHPHFRRQTCGNYSVLRDTSEQAAVLKRQRQRKAWSAGQLSMHSNRQLEHWPMPLVPACAPLSGFDQRTHLMIING